MFSVVCVTSDLSSTIHHWHQSHNNYFKHKNVKTATKTGTAEVNTGLCEFDTFRWQNTAPFPNKHGWFLVCQKFSSLSTEHNLSHIYHIISISWYFLKKHLSSCCENGSSDVKGSVRNHLDTKVLLRHREAALSLRV